VSYHIYQTEGIILSKRDVGEADRIFSILTKDLGRIDAMAQGARYLKSKLRYNLNAFDYCRFGLVATRDFWRIIDAEELNSWPTLRASFDKLAALSRIAALINRMVKGQEPDFYLWNEVKNTFAFLEKNGILKDENGKGLEAFELLTTLKILSLLGYVADAEKWVNLPLDEAQKIKPLMVSIINKALQESQL